MSAQDTLKIATIDYQSAYPFWMSGCISDRYTAALRHREQIELFQARRVHDCLEVTNERLKRKIGNIPIGQPATARIIAIEGMEARPVLEPRLPDWTVRVILKMTHP